MSITTKSQFVSVAAPITVVVDGIPFQGEVKQFSTGSVGYYVNGKMVHQVGKSLSPILVNVAGSPVQGTPMQFKSGNAGWNINGKVSIQLPNGEVVRCQVSGNPTIVGSKENGVSEDSVVKVQVGISIILVGSKEMPWELPTTPAAPVAPPVVTTEAPVGKKGRRGRKAQVA